MKALPLLALAAAGLITFTGCVKNDYYNTKPAHNDYYNLYDEEFSNDNAGWSFTDSRDSAYADVAQGTYELVNYSSTRDQALTVFTGANMQYDFLVQTKMQSNNAMGVVFGASKNDNGFAFYTDNQGYFSLYYEGSYSSAPYPLVAWTFDNNIIKGGWNNVEIEQVGNYWTGYINGKQVFHIPSQVLYGSQCGFKVLAGTTAYADYLEVKW